MRPESLSSMPTPCQHRERWSELGTGILLMVSLFQTWGGLPLVFRDMSRLQWLAVSPTYAGPSSDETLAHQIGKDAAGKVKDYISIWRHH